MSIFMLLEHSQMALLLTVAVFSLLVGSFLNVVIYRYPIMMKKQWKSECEECLGIESTQTDETFNLMHPRSACPKCHRMIQAWENIPVISYLLQKGRCKGCDNKISWQYPLVELCTMGLSLLAVMQFGYGWPLLAALVFTWVLIALFMIDAQTMYLPDDLTLPLLWLGILVNYFQGFVDLESSIMGCMVGYLSLWTLFHAFRLCTGKEGMGYGDFKLLAAIGAWGGWQVLPFVVFMSSIFGAIFGIAIILLRRQGSQAFPFGPWLASAGLCALFWRAEVVRWMENILFAV